MKLNDKELEIIRDALACDHTSSLPPIIKDKVYSLLNKINKELTKHHWKLLKPAGTYDDAFQCTKCGQCENESADRSYTKPEFGCIGKS